MIETHSYPDGEKKYYIILFIYITTQISSVYYSGSAQLSNT